MGRGTQYNNISNTASLVTLKRISGEFGASILQECLEKLLELFISLNMTLYEHSFSDMAWLLTVLLKLEDTRNLFITSQRTCLKSRVLEKMISFTMPEVLR